MTYVWKRIPRFLAFVIGITVAPAFSLENDRIYILNKKCIVIKIKHIDSICRLFKEILYFVYNCIKELSRKIRSFSFNLTFYNVVILHFRRAFTLHWFWKKSEKLSDLITHIHISPLGVSRAYWLLKWLKWYYIQLNSWM